MMVTEIRTGRILQKQALTFYADIFTLYAKKSNLICEGQEPFMRPIFTFYLWITHLSTGALSMR